MKRIDVSVQFTGTVMVLVPEHLSAADARKWVVKNRR